MIRGCVSFAQGTKVVNQTITYGSTKPAIEESIKGFATDFASEYFTWSDDNFSERNTRLAPFISGISQDAGLKSLDIKGSSRVLSADVYDAKKISDSQLEITVMVRREVTVPPSQAGASGASAQSATLASNASSNKTIKKAYMVVPITVTDKGPVIRTYPRFVTETKKGESESQAPGTSITDTAMLGMAKELTESFLRSWYDGNMSQLKYFYAESSKVPTSITKSNFTFDKADSLNMYKLADQENAYRIIATVVVKSDIGESFTNTWTLTVTSKDGKLFVLSVGDPPAKEADSTQSVAKTGIPKDGQSIPASQQSSPSISN